METLFTWLHLSDLHARAAGVRGPTAGLRLADQGGGPHERMLAALRQDIVDCADARPEVLLVTGDLAWSGSREDYAAARRWLLDTARAIGLDADRIYVVPGNHDVERDASKRNEGLELRLLSDLREGRRRLDLALEKPAARTLLTARLAAFSELGSALGPAPSQSSRAPAPGAPVSDYLEFSHVIEGDGGLRVRLIGLCTAWLAIDDEDRGALRVGTAALERARATIAPGELVVVLAHHPVRGGWLGDERDAEAWMSANAHVLLTGQVHDAFAEEARAGHPGPYVWIAAGASPATSLQGESGRRMGWSFSRVVRAPDGAISVQVAPRRWSPGRRRFLADDEILRDGSPFSERPLRLRLGAPPRRIPSPPPTTRIVRTGRSQAPSGAPPPLPPPLPSTLAAPPRNRAAPVGAPAHEPALRIPKPALLPSFGAAVPRVRIPAPAPAPLASAPSPIPAATTRPPPPSLPPAPAPPPPAARAPNADAPAPASFPSGRPLQSHGLFEGPGALPAFPIPYFVGRVDEMTALGAALADPDLGCLVATGLGGVGKTSLVQHYIATRARELFDESAWIDARELAAELGRVAKRFGWRHEDRSPTVDEAGDFLREALASRRVLLVIDNVDPGMASVRAFPVPGPGSQSRMVVTSRIVTLHEDLGRRARSLRLGTWDDATCRAHFREVVPALAREPDSALDRLARRVGGLPLAVRLLAKQLLRPGVSTRTLAERLELEPLTALDSAARGVERTVVATFQSALDGLGDAERRVLHALAACAPATRAEVVAAVAGMREADAAMALEGLAEQSLVEWLPEAEQPFRLHDVVRFLVTSLPGAEAARAAHDTWALDRVAGHRADGAWKALDGEVAEVLAVVDNRLRRADGPGAWEALATILPSLDRRGMFGELVATATRVLAAVPPDSEEAAAVQGNLGIAWCSLGDITQATRCLEQALAISEARRSPLGQALALSGLGRCRSAVGRWDEAITFHRRAATIHELTGTPRSLAEDLGNVGLAYRRAGDVSKAIEYLEEARAIYDELPPVEGRAEVLGGLGLCFRDIGELPGAVDYFQRALAIHEELGRPGGQATMLGNLGNAYRTLGDTALAIDHLERALSRYEELGQLDGQGVALGNLGACYRATGDRARSREYFERAHEALRRAGLPDDHPHMKMVLGALGKRGPGKTNMPGPM